jgi:adenylate cyclase
MSIDENDSECHRVMCRIALMQGQYAKSEHHLERALALNPNDPRLAVQRGVNLTILGDPEAAIPWIERAMRLDPLRPSLLPRFGARPVYGRTHPEALAVLERTARADWEHHLWLAAQPAGRKAVALRPHLSIATYVDGLALKRDVDKARLCAALARAGLPR